MFTHLLDANYHLFTDINTYAGHWVWLDDIMVFCANSLIFAWPIVMLLLWGRPQTWRKRELRPGETQIIQECRAIVIWIALACLLSYLFNLAIEHFLFEPRPFITHHVHLLASHTNDGSFPSDHTAWSFAVVGMMLFSLPTLLHASWQQRLDAKKQGAKGPLLRPLLLMGLALVMACCIGIARVFVGVHYPGDIVGGAITGLFAAAIITLVRQHWLQQPTHAIVTFVQHLHLA
jgi:undecaprenyl-diphosphatase